MSFLDALMTKLGSAAKAAEPTLSDTGQEILWSLPAALGAGLARRGSPGGVAAGALLGNISKAEEGKLAEEHQLRPLRKTAADMRNMLPEFNQWEGPLSPEQTRYRASLNDIIQQDPQQAMALLNQRGNAEEKYKWWKLTHGGNQDPKTPYQTFLKAHQGESWKQINDEWWKQLGDNQRQKDLDKYPAQYGTMVNTALGRLGFPPDRYRQLRPDQRQEVLNRAAKMADDERISLGIGLQSGAQIQKAKNEMFNMPASVAQSSRGLSWVDPKTRQILSSAEVGAQTQAELRALGYTSLSKEQIKPYEQARAVLNNLKLYQTDIVKEMTKYSSLTGLSLASVAGSPARKIIGAVDPAILSRLDPEINTIAELLGRLGTGGAMRSQQLFEAQRHVLEAPHGNVESVLKAIDAQKTMVTNMMDSLSGGKNDFPPVNVPNPTDDGSVAAPPPGMAEDSGGEF